MYLHDHSWNLHIISPPLKSILRNLLTFLHPRSELNNQKTEPFSTSVFSMFIQDFPKVHIILPVKSNWYSLQCIQFIFLILYFSRTKIIEERILYKIMY